MLYIDSAPSLGVYYFLSLTLSVCHSAPSNCFFFFVSQWNRAIFWPSVLHVALCKTVFLDFWFRSPIPQNLLPKICTKLPITRLVWQIDRRCFHLTGFSGMADSMEPCKCCGANPCCHGNEILANLGYFRPKSPISRLVCQIDGICLGIPGGRPGGVRPSMATTFALGAESSRLPACICCMSAYLQVT